MEAEKEGEKEKDEALSNNTQHTVAVVNNTQQIHCKSIRPTHPPDYPLCEPHRLLKIKIKVNCKKRLKKHSKFDTSEKEERKNKTQKKNYRNFIISVVFSVNESYLCRLEEFCCLFYVLVSSSAGPGSMTLDLRRLALGTRTYVRGGRGREGGRRGKNDE
jgi:hypothetical protein